MRYDRVPEELWTEVRDIVQEAVIKTIPKKKAKRLSEEALQVAEKRKEAKGKGEEERYTHLNAEFQRRAGRENKAFFSDQCREIEEDTDLAVVPREKAHTGAAAREQPQDSPVIAR